ncbi:MAG: S41 family peptidase [Thermodesulfobacteriota bacterium]|nr:S41 family peptidase [Thermodesulfobacteriota bacterium]
MPGSKKKLVLDIVLLSFFVGGILFLNGNTGEVKADTDEVYKNIEVFTDVLRQVERNYVEPQDPQELIYGAIKGMIRSLDPHSSFMTKEEHGELILETKGSFMGIGIEITIRDNILTVVSPIEGTPADKAGIRAGDKIIKIETQSTKDMTMMEAVKKIRGPKGTRVELTIAREGMEKPLEFSITRDVIPLISVRHHFLTPEIGYVRISNFQSNTKKELSSALEALEKDGKPKGLILDLRNNPGGLLSQSIEVADIFLSSGSIVSTKGRNTSQNIKATAHENQKSRDYPIIALINGGSASAAEIVAGALQDNKRAIILGTRSFGKGSVQTIFSLADGSGLRLTTARYYTPNGKSIQLSGITPDIELAFVPPSNEKEELPHRFTREEDLEGHMPLENRESADDEPETEKDKQVEVLLGKDNQVRHALQLLQTWSVFSRIKADT